MLKNALCLISLIIACYIAADLMVSTAYALDSNEITGPTETSADQPDQPQDQTGQPPDQTTLTTEVMMPSVVGWLELSEQIREGPLPFAWISKEEAGLSLEDVTTQLNTVAEGEQYLGLIIYLDDPILNFTQITTIGQAIQRVRDSGKQVLAFAEHYDLWGYLVACHADMILLQHKGTAQLSGLATEEFYMLGLLDKIGVQANLIQIGKYKGADEAYTRSEPSEEWSSNIDSLLDDFYQQIIDIIVKGRNMSVDEIEQALADIWSMKDVDYLKYRLIDRLTDRDMIDVTEIEFGDQFTWDETMGLAISGRMKMDSPFAILNMLLKEPSKTTRRPTIAILHSRGPIHSGESSIGDGLFAAETIGSRTLVRELGDCRDDPNIKGIIVRIDSPGGSASASEVIWQAIREVGAAKPVYISIGPLAASGGYYIACAGDEIYVSPQSIVGSIGVVGGKVVLGGLYEKLGITVTRRSRGPMSDLFNSVQPFDEQQRETIHASLIRVYEQFIERVQIGRGVRLADITQVAEGRLFTGRQAAGNGLADHLGGIDETLADMVSQLGLQEGEYDILNLPRPMSLHEFFNKAFGAQTKSVHPDISAIIETARHALGPLCWDQARQVLTGLMLLHHEPVLTLMPTVIILK